jgi:hypothetical protein
MNCCDRFLLFQHRSGAWCATPPGYRNLLQDPLGWGPSRVEAVRDLLCHLEFLARAARGELPLAPGFGRFVEALARARTYLASWAQTGSRNSKAPRRATTLIRIV